MTLQTKQTFKVAFINVISKVILIKVFIRFVIVSHDAIKNPKQTLSFAHLRCLMTAFQKMPTTINLKCIGLQCLTDFCLIIG
jgi:hypothetical protein